MERGTGENESEMDRDEEEAVNEILRDRFRLCTISIAEAEGILISFWILDCIILCKIISYSKFFEQQKRMGWKFRNRSWLVFRI